MAKHKIMIHSLTKQQKHNDYRNIFKYYLRFIFSLNAWFMLD